MGWLRKKYEQAKAEVKSELKHRAKVKKVQNKSYKAAQIREARKFGLKKARYESEQKIKALKNPKPAYTYGGFAGPTTKQPTPSLGVADYLTGSSQTGRKGVSKRKEKSVSQGLRDMGL